MYVLALVGAIYLAILFDRYPTMILLWIVVLAPLWGAVCVAVWKRTIQVTCSLADSVAQKGEDTAVYLTISNRSPFPLQEGRILFSVQHQLEEEPQQQQISCSVDGFATERIRIPVSCTHCGMVEFGVKQFRTIDYFGIFSGRKKQNAGETLIVLPNLLSEEQLETETLQKEQLEPAGENQITVYGEPEDVSGTVREYRLGDAPKQIHWKLSAKKQQWMVREYQMEAEQRRVVYFAFVYGDMQPDYDWYDEKIETFLHNGQKLLEEQQKYEVVWYHPGEETVYQEVVEQETELLLLTEKIIEGGIGASPGAEQMEVMASQLCNDGIGKRKKRRECE